MVGKKNGVEERKHSTSLLSLRLKSSAISAGSDQIVGTTTCPL